MLKNKSGPQSEQVKRNIQQIFKEHGLDIIIQCSMKVVNYLDGTFKLNDETYKPYKKLNSKIKYTPKNSNHPPSVIWEIPVSMESGFSTLSFKEKIFQKAMEKDTDSPINVLKMITTAPTKIKLNEIANDK